MRTLQTDCICSRRNLVLGDTNDLASKFVLSSSSGRAMAYAHAHAQLHMHMCMYMHMCM